MFSNCQPTSMSMCHPNPLHSIMTKCSMPSSRPPLNMSSLMVDSFQNNRQWWGMVGAWEGGNHTMHAPLYGR
jgi:hypothetical protein